MSAHTAISIDDYLRTSFDNPDREFRDGEVVERTQPGCPHAGTMAQLGFLFHELRRSHRIFPAISVRLRISAERIVVPDVCVFAGTEPLQLPDKAPLIAIEVLSPEDRFCAVRDKLEEYKKWGVRHVWLADPHSKRLYICDAGLHEVASFKVPEFDLELKPEEIFD